MDIRRVFDSFFKKRALPIHMIRDAGWIELDRLMSEGVLQFPYVHDIFLDNNVSYITFFDRGNAYKMDFEVSNGTVSFQEFVQIEFVHAPVEQSRVKIQRTKDGKVLWYAVASSTVLNRSGEIDSTELFDMFERDFDSYESKPYLTFYHENDPKFRFGEVLGVKRSENLLLAWGTMDEEHPIGSLAIKSINKSSGEIDYGLSIGFMSTEQARMVEIAENISVPTYNKGYLVEISLLQESDAAAIYTTIKTEN